ncbi:MAG: RNHCP domain-containing protein [Candidatus Moranbacteria bacterium]|nr:RNHCP domain-containing protein [Candidatus Moranbacteria bacterium]
MNKLEFICQNCLSGIRFNNKKQIKNRNHCAKCLYSRHLDLNRAGDRLAKCKGLMKPIGLCFKKQKPNKYRPGAQKGELMLIHKCEKCNKISINRIAVDDDESKLIKILENARDLNQETIQIFKKQGIQPIQNSDEKEVLEQLFGKTNV